MNKPFTYKVLIAPNHEIISRNIYNYIAIKTNILNDPQFWSSVNVQDVLENIPLLTEFLKIHNMKAKAMAVIVTPANTQGYIHIDTVPDIRVLWPIKNCKGSFTRFFNIDKKFVKLDYLENGIPYMNITHPGPFEQIDELELIQPVLINPGIGHGIYTNPEITEPRITFTIKV